MVVSGYTLLAHVDETHDAAALECRCRKRLRLIRVLALCSMALTTGLAVAICHHRGSHEEHGFTGKTIDMNTANDLIDNLFDLALKASPLHSVPLDNTTLGRPGQLARLPRVSLLSPSYSQPSRPSSHLLLPASLLPLPFSPWARYRLHFRAEPTSASDAQMLDSEQVAPTPASDVREPPSISSSRLDMSPSTMLTDDGVGIKGRWKEVAGNFVLYPKDIEVSSPRGIIHFLGGAFVGAAPHLTYRYLLEALCDEGYIVVTTPYRLDFDYVKICRGILSKFDVVRAELDTKFGVLPMIGMGHSCGALLHTLITSLFPEPRVANVLISFNNKPAKEAIPGLDEFVAPLSETVMGTSSNAENARELIATARNVFDGVLSGFSTSDVAPPVVKDELVPAVQQSLELVDQIPDLLSRIAGGTTEFTPSPKETKETILDKYRTRRTLLIQFESDAIDETLELEKVLREASALEHVDTPKMDMDVEVRRIVGTHVTPLTQNVFIDPPQELQGVAVPDPLSPLRQQVRENFLQTINEVKTDIVQYLAQRY